MTSSVEVLVLGCGAVGKTLISRRIRHELQSEKAHGSSKLNAVTTPTTGMQFEKIRLEGKEITIRETGYDMARLWHKYYKKADVLLFAVDASRRCQLACASVELLRILQNPSVAEKPLIIIYNKIDQALCMDVESIRQFMHIEELKTSRKVLEWYFSLL